MIARLIELSARHAWMTLILVAVAAGWGWYAAIHSPLDAIPDLSDTQVIIFTEWEGQSPDIVEDQITYPITTSLLAAPRVRSVRGQSMFGMSFVYAIFEDGTDVYWARSRVLEYLNEVSDALPDVVAPTLGPDATGVGWVFQYALIDEAGKHDLQQLRSLQDWYVRYALESVAGVAEVASVGGYVKEYQILVDPERLRAYGVGVAGISETVRAANRDVGGQVLELAEHEYMVRGRGYLRGVEDLRSLPLTIGPGGVPVTLGQVAEVQTGPAHRRGFAELDGRGEVVGGIVIMRYGENALTVIDALKTRIAEIESGLPEGVRLAITYDRSGLIEASIDTLRRTLVEEMLIVSVVIALFLMHARSALVPILTLPLGVLLAFIPMFYQGLTINIMSLGGIAVAIGAMVDASIILIENVHKRLEAWETSGRREDRRAVLVHAMQEVGPSVFFSLLVITVSFLPVFTLEGVEGRLFKPLAFTKTYSMGFAAILAVTLTPALVVLLVRGRVRREDENRLNRWLVAAYVPVVRFVVRHRRPVILLALAGTLTIIPAYLDLESEFMPPLNEGALLYMPTAPPGMSSREASRVLQAMNERLKSFPEVESAFGKMGRAETATDPAPIGMVETVVVLKPRDQWRPGLTWNGLIDEMDAALDFPGMPNIWWMPIQTRVEMLSTGIRSPLGVKIFGDDLETIERTAIEIEQAVSAISGTRSAYADRSTGGFYVDIQPDRAQAARYGLHPGHINDVVQTAIGGMRITTTVEGRERYAVSVRYARDFREDPAALERVLVETPTGLQIPLGQVARVEFVTGPPMIRSESGKLVGYVFIDAGDRAIADYVAEAREAVAASVSLPPGVRIAWAGQFEYYERAKQRLFLVVPVTLVLIGFLLYLNTGSAVEVAIVLLAVPFSAVGAIWLLWLLDYHMSVAVWVGIIALAGLDAETGVVMLLYLTLAHKDAAARNALRNLAELTDAIVEGAAKRVRPKLMTVLTTFIALLPVMWSTGTGSDVMKRIAAPMVGGLFTSFLLELTVYPAIFAVWKSRSLVEAAALGRRGEE
jgi:Cu(I)/Ag(I) efflux system membrane protein CusA/SilA